MRMAPHFRSFVLHKIEHMEQFKDFTLSAIENEKKSIQDRFARDTKDLTEEEEKEYFDWNAEDYFLVEDEFTSISMYSFIVILYSYVERGLNTICNAEYSDKARLHKKEGKHPFEIRYKDMKSDGIHRAKIYLEKVIGLNLHSDKKPWSEIETLRKIRNAIVHVGGKVTDQIRNDGNVEQHILHGRLEFTNHDPKASGKVLIKAEYLDVIIKAAKEFFRNIEQNSTQPVISPER